MKHTELPWDFIEGMKDTYIGNRQTKESVGVVYDVDNAQFIVKACNMHDELVEALREVLSVIEGDESEWWMSLPERGGFNATRIRAALKEADNVES